MAKNVELVKDEDVFPDYPPSPIISSKSITRSRKMILQSDSSSSFSKLDSADVLSDRLLAYHSRMPLRQVSEIGPDAAETPAALELPFFPGNSRSPSAATILPQLRQDRVDRSETVDEIAADLLALNDVQTDQSINFFEIKKETFRGAKLLEVLSDISADDSVLTKGQKLEVVEWINEDVIEVQVKEAKTRIFLQPETLQALRPFGVSNVEDLQMFTLPELMNCVNTNLGRLFDNNVVEVIKDFIQFRPKYFQEVQNVGGRLPLFPVMASLEFTELSIRYDDNSYENKACQLLENGEIHYDVDENFRDKLPNMDLTSWAFVKYKQSWKVVLMTASKVVREMLDYHEVFQDPTCDVLLPNVNSNCPPSQSLSSVFQSLSSKDLVPGSTDFKTNGGYDELPDVMGGLADSDVLIPFD